MKAETNPRWNPANPIRIAPEEYEKQVVSWLRSAGQELQGFTVNHLRRVRGNGGEYSIDGWAEFEVFGGVKICVLVECKRHKRPVERDVILGVQAKAQAVGAQKSIVFSTSGFQRGAVEFATSVGIALIIFVDGKLTYATRSRVPISKEGYPNDLPEFAGQMIQSEGNRTLIMNIADDCTNPLAEWLMSEGYNRFG